MRADMHTHSVSSHDSVCRIEDMARSQHSRGTDIFAVTDHFDTDSFQAYDVFTPIQTAAETVAELNKHSSGQQLILAGVEISEGFWHPVVYEKIRRLVDYDVVIGSVHLVKYKELTRAYSGIDFSKLPREITAEYLDAYFDDMLTMLDTIDFDILAHLTCPLRYINGKYGLGMELTAYREKIETILSEIIRKEIALEVNTSSLSVLHELMPTADILKKYRAMGGKLLTLGSDAHVAENASIHFDRAIETMKALGFDSIFYYKGRKPFELPI